MKKKEEGGGGRRRNKKKKRRKKEEEEELFLYVFSSSYLQIHNLFFILLEWLQYIWLLLHETLLKPTCRIHTIFRDLDVREGFAWHTASIHINFHHDEYYYFILEESYHFVLPWLLHCRKSPGDHTHHVTGTDAALYWVLILTSEK